MTDLFELEAPQDDQGATEAGPAHMQPPAPVSQLTKHWKAAIAEFDVARECPRSIRALMALGAIRAVYWLALGGGEVALAREIAEWWADCEPLHGLGETIK
ncbi:hypothetical protein J9893_08885 [Aeromonas sp. MaB10011B]|uniref:hypothetical protein n=1 Tax=unclassified Aeromonas TaxID=257493 RepID=UPI001B334F93|nr:MULTISPECIES: hypothetical protein [unclassified Aeromonas]MBP4067109.1 hypothetical protein [Aeromonas sp. MaB10011B]MBP4078507.1 hypothetical protein [Aeromonas sp. MrichA-1]